MTATIIIHGNNNNTFLVEVEIDKKGAIVFWRVLIVLVLQPHSYCVSLSAVHKLSRLRLRSRLNAFIVAANDKIFKTYLLPRGDK